MKCCNDHCPFSSYKEALTRACAVQMPDPTASAVKLQAVFGGGGGGSGVKDQIDTAIDALVKGSRSFQAHHRRPVVLVLDDVDKCACQHLTAL